MLQPAGASALARAGAGARAALVLLAWLSCAAAAAQDAGLDALDRCVEAFEGETFTRVPRAREIEERCPDLRPALESSPHAAWLPEAWWPNHVSPGALEDLKKQIASEANAGRPETIDTRPLAAVLATLSDEAAAERVSWWQRFKDWLAGRFDVVERDESSNWLVRFLFEIGKYELTLKIIAYVLVALIVLLALVVVVNEMRAAGVFGPRSRAARLRRQLEEQRAAREPGLDDLERCEPRERPSLLLALVVATLTRRPAAKIDASVTHRELLARFVPASAEQGAQLARLAGCAERVRYAAAPPSREDIDKAVDGGRRLLAAMADEPVAKPA